LLEQALGFTAAKELVYVSKRKGQEVRIHASDQPGDEISLLFGRMPGRVERVEGDSLSQGTITPARLTVYDAALRIESITPQMRESLDDELTEVKSESAIDRLTSQSQARTLERVPAGASFQLRLVLDVLCEEDKELIPVLLQGLSLLEDDSLGGGGSRGSGRVRFGNLKLTWRNAGFYRGGTETEVASVADTAGLRQAVGEIASKLVS
jgi:CRISPR-associated protein Csm3